MAETAFGCNDKEDDYQARIDRLLGGATEILFITIPRGSHLDTIEVETIYAPIRNTGDWTARTQNHKFDGSRPDNIVPFPTV